MIKDDSVYLRHILEAINKIEEYTNETKYQIFIENSLIQDGVIRQIEIIGEAVKNISEKLKNNYPNIPWKDISGMRDKLIHDYLGVDVETIWDTVEKDIPVFKKDIENILGLTP